MTAIAQTLDRRNVISAAGYAAAGLVLGLLLLGARESLYSMQGQVTMLAAPVAHRLAGGLVLATAVVLAVRVLSASTTAGATVAARDAVGVAG